MDKIEGLVQNLATQWKTKTATTAPKWWQFWKQQQFMNAAIQFLMDSLDEMILHVDKTVDIGPDKKATVLAAAAMLYDLVVKDILPLWLSPFSGSIRVIVIYTIVSLAIDFIVSKYHNKIWKAA